MPRKKLISISTVIFFIAIIFFLPAHFVFSQSLDTSDSNLANITQQINSLNDSLNKSIAATKPLQSELTSIQTRIDAIKRQVAAIEADTVVKKKQIDDGYKDLASKEKIINNAIRDHYMNSFFNSPLLIFLSADSAFTATQTLAYQQAKTKQDTMIMTNVALTIDELEKKKAQLEQEQKFLISARASLSDQSAKLDKVIKEAQAYQTQVSMQISELSAQQQSIINAKGTGFTTTLGDSSLADDYNASSKGFRESAPAGYFAIFSYGAYTHRKGMSQYGAMGRANNGQDYHAILKAYYGKDTTNVDSGGSIKVSGSGDVDFETNYLYGIAEMPSSFPTEALKAQAIAARSYAWNYKKDGKEICTTESCQVYSSSKAANPPDAWKAAVDATKGQIVDGVTAYFSSTAGGYLETSGWDTTDGQGGPSFADKSYEKIAGSPWFYKAWYRKGYSNTGDTCGRSSAWLSPVEMGDLVNAYLVMTRGTSDEKNRIIPVSCWGGNPYSIDELKNVAGKYGGISSATSVSVTQGNGTTSNVTINGISMSGKDFRNAVYLRAPGYIRIPQGSFPDGYAFFNIEKK